MDEVDLVLLYAVNGGVAALAGLVGRTGVLVPLFVPLVGGAARLRLLLLLLLGSSGGVVVLDALDGVDPPLTETKEVFACAFFAFRISNLSKQTHNIIIQT